MKIFSQIRYVLFALMIVGVFANLAQNEYGFELLFHCCFLTGITLLVESFIYLANKKKEKASRVFHLFTESFFLGFIFISFETKQMQWGITAPLMFGSSVIITLLYIVAAFRILFSEFKFGKRAAIAMFLFILSTIVSIDWQFFKMMHWPGANTMLWVSSIYSGIIIIYFLIRIKYFYKGEKITIVKRIRTLPGKLPMAYCWFSVWLVYVALIVLGIAPDFYRLNIPPSLQKLKDENSPQAQVYSDNYDIFLENRKNAKE
jgi:hypothetical protein